MPLRVRVFLLLSSAAVYGNPQTLPVGEDQPVAPLSPYGFHKRQAELLVEEFARIYGLKGAVARIFSAYGPGLRRQVIWDICDRLLAGSDFEPSVAPEQRLAISFTRRMSPAGSRCSPSAPLRKERFTISQLVWKTSIAELAQRLAATLGRNVQATSTAAVVRVIREIGGRTFRSCAALGFHAVDRARRGLAQVAQWAAAELGGVIKKSE
jgi:UDP-glucose 4-epimerase